MKVLYLSDLWDPARGSMIRQIHATAARLRERGIETTLVSTRQDGGKLDSIEVDGLRIHRIPSRYPVRFRPVVGLRNRRVVGPLEEILRAERPDVVHAHLVHTHLSYRALTLAKRAGARLIFSAHDAMTFCYQKMDCFHGGEAKRGEGADLEARWTKCWPCQGLRFLPGRNRRIREVLERDVDEVTAVSGALGDRLEAHGITVDHVVPNATLERPQPPLDARRHGRARWSLGDGPVMLFAGGVQAQKGILVTLGAHAAVLHEEPRARLLVAGRQDQWERYAAPEARRLGVEGSCVVTGWLDESELEQAYAAADYLCVPSTCFETFGLVHLEAQARGLPCIGTVYGGVPEVIADGETGYVVNPFDGEALAAACRRLAREPDLRRRFGAAARERARDRFALEEISARWLEIYGVPREAKLTPTVLGA